MTGRQCDACERGVHCFDATRCDCCRREPEPVPAADVRRPSGPAAQWTAIARLIRHADTWLIEYHPGPVYWSAERVTGTEIRYLAAHSLDELADRIGAAEASP